MSTFPIMSFTEERKALGLGRTDSIRDSIPWELIGPHEAQAQANHGGQTLKRLAERGGLSAGEAVAVIEDRRWRNMPYSAARARLEELVRDFELRAKR